MIAPPPPTSPWQRLYGGAHRLRRRWYRRRARWLPRPVVSIGNLHWGGTGKTPLTAAVAAWLRDRGLAVCILSRGYASRGQGVRVVSDGGGPLLGPLLAGDEPVLLAGELPGVAVVVGADRHAAGLAAMRRLPAAPDLFLLDDGFSHLALARDLDLLAFPATDPWAGGRLPPGGRLREPLASAARASAVILTGVPGKNEKHEEGAPPLAGAGAEPASAPTSTHDTRDFEAPPRGGAPSAAGEVNPGAALARALHPYGFGGPGFASWTRAGAPRWTAGPEAGAEVRPGTRLLLVSGVARPDAFTAAARAAGLEVAGELRFPDHHAYPEASLGRISTAVSSSGAGGVLTTAKDRVKLHGRLDLPLAELPVHAEPEPAFWQWLDRALEGVAR